MRKTNGYFTKGRIKILEYLKEHNDRMLTAYDISDYLKEIGSSKNASTIYRYLEELVQSGLIIKQIDPDAGMAAFRYVPEKCHKHLHMQCSNCGRIIHLECGFMIDIERHLQEKHGFELECKSSVLNGVCEKCRLVNKSNMYP